MKNKSILTPFCLRLIWILLFLGIWEIMAHSSLVNALSFPSLKLIGQSLLSSIFSGEIVYQILYSLGLILLGLIIGVFSSLILSFLAILHPIFESLMDALVSIFHPLPGIALLPLIILWIGTGSKAVVFIIVHSVLWPMILNLSAGFKSIPSVYKKIGQNYEFSLLKIVTKIYIPASLPYIIAGLKIGWARAWRAAISAEMIFGATGGQGGIGWYLFNKRVFMDTPGLFAGLILIIIIGIGIDDLVFDKIEKLTIRKWGISS
ncbi:ABC transporter permease subunit [Irregularibacter muris]|uniref:ABC transporter permease subunit n=1 Tax=Irregularibacter muris TaxID=1796619 RepID=A0AAE3KZP3_9FIRM|nr:ABC transporter permease subunit [Irregularibacter muris]MCR1898936.1 ABC transporter permease subunit [Irregularibacter muris]